jgi:hypothetical protein
LDDRDIRERVARVEGALEKIEGLPAAPRETALDAVGALVDLYGEGWARALAAIRDHCPGGAEVMAEDELVSHLLMLHGLHPTGIEGRIRGAIEEVEAAVNADGLVVELVGVESGVARLKFGGNGHAPIAGLQDLVKETVFHAVPELDRVDLELPAIAGEGEPALVQLRRASRNDEEGSPAGTEP